MRAALVLACVALATVACGKKGNPLAPFVRIPAPVMQITTARLGSDVYITVTVPAQNIDTSMPADLGRIDIYGYTGRLAPPVARFAELGSVVASLPVAPPPDPLLPVPMPPFGFIDPEGAWQGTMATVRDRLTEEELVQGPELPVILRRGQTATPAALPVAQPLGALKRFYVAIPWSRRGRPGPPGTIVEFPLTALPDPPTDVRATYTETTLNVGWEPSGGLLGFILDKSLPPEPAPFEAPLLNLTAAVPVAPLADAAVPAGPTAYTVYQQVSPDPLLLAPSDAATWVEPVPVGIGAGAALAMATPVEFGRPQCYVVRAQRGTSPPVMSEPSPPFCFTPVDVFPPAAPTGLAAVPAEGAINLIWEPNAELDLGGYLVLRREGSDATLRLLTETPIVDARFRDTEVKPGVRYVYSVVAVDAQLPLPNMSAESLRVEELAR